MAIDAYGNTLNFDEWRQEQDLELAKGPSLRFGGTRTSVTPASQALVTQNGPSGRSQYQSRTPPPPTIDDVDLNGNWYSPFQPIAPFGAPLSPVREWDYPVGYNLNYIQPRQELMWMLRNMRASWGVLATVIETRKDQLLRIPWTIQQRGRPRHSSVAIDQMKKFFRRPDGKLSYSQWTRKLTDDLLVIDAPAIYFARDRKGRPLGAEVMDGATIFPLIDDAGRRPSSVVDITEEGITYLRRQPAFQQIIKGTPLADLDESELMYVPMRPRPDFPMFGYAPTEQILVQATGAIRKMFYQTNFWAENTIPDLIVTVPDTWSPRNIAIFQAHFDGLMSGNIPLKSKVRFLPGGMKPFDVKNANGESMWASWDEAMIRLVCYAYSVSPAPFVHMMNRSTAQNAQQAAEEEGLYPLMSYWKDDIMDVIIQEKFGYEDLEFVFQPRPEPDQEKQAKIHDMKVKNGELCLNEARAEDGLEPVPGGEVHTIQIGNAIIPVEMAAKGLAMPVQGGTGTSDQPGGGSGSAAKPKSKAKPGKGQSAANANAGPQRGLPRPRTDSPSPKPSAKQVAKALLRLSRSELNSAAQESRGGHGRVSDLTHHIGNYKKGHVRISGLDISIENARGSQRAGVRKDGAKWKVKMPAHYGYIRGTLGADDMQVDCYLGRHPQSNKVWVIDQHKVGASGKVKDFDEHKVMLGYKKAKKAVSDYTKAYSDGNGHARIGHLTEMSMDEFKTWLKAGDTRSPLREQSHGTAVAKLDTISTATNLSSNFPAPPKKKKRRKVERGTRWKELGAGF